MGAYGKERERKLNQLTARIRKNITLCQPYALSYMISFSLRWWAASVWRYTGISFIEIFKTINAPPMHGVHLQVSSHFSCSLYQKNGDTTRIR
jgi:hypothetical protein